MYECYKILPPVLWENIPFVPFPRQGTQGTVAYHSQVDRANAITPGRTKPFMLRTILRPTLLDLLIHHQIAKPEASWWWTTGSHGHMPPFHPFLNTVLVSYDSPLVSVIPVLKWHLLQLALTSRAQTPLSISKIWVSFSSAILCHLGKQISGSLTMWCNQRWFS